MTSSNYLTGVGKIESGGNYDAKNKHSSASGKYQITRKTFELLQKKYPREFGNLSFEEMLKSPALQNAAASYLTASNKEDLQKSGIANPSDTDLYLAHHIGSGRAAKALKSGENTLISDFLTPQEMEINPHLKGKTVGSFSAQYGKAFGQNPQNVQVAGNPAPIQPIQPVQPNTAVAQRPAAPTGPLWDLMGRNVQSPQTPRNSLANTQQFARQMALKYAGQQPQIPQMVNMPNMASGVQQQPSSMESSRAFARNLADRYSNYGNYDPTRMAASGGLIERYATGGAAAIADDQPWNDKWGNLEGGGNPVATMATGVTPSIPGIPSREPLTSPSESAPWEDYAKEKAASTPTRAKKPAAVQGDGFLDKTKNFFGKALDKSAQALNTRPEQVSGSLLSGGFKVRDKTAEEEKLGPTGAANRAKRTAAFLQGAALDLPAAVAQMLPGKTGEDLANAQLAGYNKFRSQLGGKDEFDLARIAGNIANPVQLKAASGIDKLLKPTGAGLFKRGAVQGAFAGATQAVDPDEQGKTDSLLTDKLAQTGGGALLGGVLNKALNKLDPNSIPALKQSDIAKYQAMFPDAYLTPGQRLGGRFNQAEQALTSAPILGNAITEGRMKALDAQNVSIMNRALKDAGLTLDKNAQAGRGMFDEAYNKLSNKYDSLLKDAKLEDPQALRAKIYGGMDTGSGSSLATADQLASSYKPGVISNDYNRLSEAGQQRFDKILESSLFSKFRTDPKGNKSLAMKGDEFKAYEEDLKDVIGDFMAGGGEDRMIGRMLKKALGEVHDSLTSSKPGVADQLKGLNKSYAQYKTLEKASTASGASEGRFTPVQAIRAASTGARNRHQVGIGKGLLQDESQLSSNVLGTKLPDSGTASRLNSTNLAKNLVFGALSLPFELLYSPLAQKYLFGGGAKNLFQGTRAGKALTSGQTAPAATRAILGPSSTSPEEEEEFNVPIARGGYVPHVMSSLAKGGLVALAARQALRNS